METYDNPTIVFDINNSNWKLLLLRLIFKRLQLVGALTNLIIY